MSELNLLPPYLKEKRQQKINIRNYTLAGIIAFGIILLLIYIPASQLINVKSEELRFKKQAEKTDGDAIIMENEKIKKEIDNYDGYIEKVKNLTENKTLISSKIHELEQYVPVDVVFDSLKYGEDGLSINATAKSLKSISEFTANLQRSGAYKNVRISDIKMEDTGTADNNTNSSGQYKFTVNAYK